MPLMPMIEFITLHIQIVHKKLKHLSALNEDISISKEEGLSWASWICKRKVSIWILKIKLKMKFLFLEEIEDKLRLDYELKIY